MEGETERADYSETDSEDKRSEGRLFANVAERGGPVEERE